MRVHIFFCQFFFNFLCSLFVFTFCVHLLCSLFVFTFFLKTFQQLTTALSQEGRHDTVSDLVELSSLLEEVRQQEDFVLEERKENEKIQKKVDAAMADIEGT